MAACPDCDAVLCDVDELEEGDFVDCDECGAELVVTDVDPLELSIADEDLDV